MGVGVSEALVGIKLGKRYRLSLLALECWQVWSYFTILSTAPGVFLLRIGYM